MYQNERPSGGANGIRTRDPHTASVVRYQLRHSPAHVQTRVGVSLYRAIIGKQMHTKDLPALLRK